MSIEEQKPQLRDQESQTEDNDSVEIKFNKLKKKYKKIKESNIEQLNANEGLKLQISSF